MKQDDLASAILFWITLMVTLLNNTFEGQQCCISIGDIEQTDESYAEDGLITEKVDEMNTILERLCVFAGAFGLAINIKKTKVMFVGACMFQTQSAKSMIKNWVEYSAITYIQSCVLYASETIIWK